MPRGLAASGATRATRATSCPEVARSPRSISMKTKLTVSEAEEVAAIARASGLTISALLRRSVLAQKIESRPPVPAINAQAYAELGRIGGNLNQLARWANNNKLPPDFGGQLAQAINNLGAAIKTTRAQLLGVKP